MRIQTRIFLGMLVVVSIAFFFLLWWIAEDFDPQYRKATEEPLVDSARILASFAASNAVDGKINVKAFRSIFQDVYAQPLNAQIYDFTKITVDFRVYLTDASGTVLFDSHTRNNVGKDFSEWLDVKRTLQGDYGARTTRDAADDPASAVMYVAAPILLNGEIVGVLSVGKPAAVAMQFAKRSKRKIILSGAAIFLVVIIVSMILAGEISRPIHMITDYARSVRDGKRARLPAVGTSEMGELGAAFEEMRDTLEGKQYVERYVQTLTHEVKSPLSAIHGAADLLKEDMPPEQRTRFLNNIQTETDRIKSVVEKLLLLSSLESKKSIQEVEQLDMAEIVDEAAKSMHPLFEKKQIVLTTSGDRPCVFEGDHFLVRHAVVNVLQNAIEFSPQGGTITVMTRYRPGGFVELAIRDSGMGIPDYATDRVYDRFYSLKRPDSGKKSSGLGLSLVKEVAALHDGNIELKGAPDVGTIAMLTFPLTHT